MREIIISAFIATAVTLFGSIAFATPPLLMECKPRNGMPCLQIDWNEKITGEETLRIAREIYGDGELVVIKVRPDEHEPHHCAPHFYPSCTNPNWNPWREQWWWQFGYSKNPGQDEDRRASRQPSGSVPDRVERDPSERISRTPDRSHPEPAPRPDPAPPARNPGMGMHPGD